MSSGALSLIAAFGVFAIGGAALAYVLVVSGRTRATTEEESTDFLMRFDPNDYATYAKMPGAMGKRREASVSLDDLRRLAKQGNWLQFWCWPIAIASLFGGITLISIGALLLAGERDKVFVATLVGTLITLLPFYFSFQALYTEASPETDTDADAQ